MVTLNAALIVKNEADHLSACLEALAPVVDDVVVLDTGSTDATMAIARTFTDKVYASERFDKTTLPGDFHFGDARNEVLGKCEADWVLSIDADERVEGAGLREWLDAADVCTHHILLHNQMWRDRAWDRFACHTPRVFPNDGSVSWAYRCHEMPMPFFPLLYIPSSVVQLHHAERTSELEHMKRNKLLLVRQLDELWDARAKGAASGAIAKTLIDLGNTCYDLGQPFEAIGYFEVAIRGIRAGNKSHSFLFLQLGTVYYTMGVMRGAIECARKALKFEPQRIAARLLLVQALMRMGQHAEAVEHLDIAESPTHGERVRTVVLEDGCGREDAWMVNARKECEEALA